jgi:hypothetical protein
MRRAYRPVLVAGCTAVHRPPAPAYRQLPAGPTSPPHHAGRPHQPSPATSTNPASQPDRCDGSVVDPALIGPSGRAQAIADLNDGIRAAGTPGYDASVDYVADQLATLGFQVDRQSFDFIFSDETEPVTLMVGEMAWGSPNWLHAALYSGSGDVSGRSSSSRATAKQRLRRQRLERLHQRSRGDGRAAAATRQKVELAQLAGAVAMISFYPAGAEPDQAADAARPAGIASCGRRRRTVADTERPRRRHRAAVGPRDQPRRRSTTSSARSRAPGRGHARRHLDSALDGPGINDNGSGVATLLAIAAAVANQPQPAATIRFGFWSAEEFGDLAPRPTSTG